jgi:hypothetical protein
MVQFISVITMLGVQILFVGGILFVSDLWPHGRDNRYDVVIFNFQIRSIAFLIVLWWAFGDSLDAADATMSNVAGTLLFPFTYFWIDANAYRRIENRHSFKWHCLSVMLLTKYLILQSTVSDSGVCGCHGRCCEPSSSSTSASVETTSRHSSADSNPSTTSIAPSCSPVTGRFSEPTLTHH